MPRKARALGVSMEELVEARGERLNKSTITVTNA